jgi:hypothetical protein
MVLPIHWNISKRAASGCTGLGDIVFYSMVTSNHRLTLKKSVTKMATLKLREEHERTS